MEIRMGSLVRDAREATGTAIIIDVFRAFTTAAIAFDRGATQITLVAEAEDALELHRSGVGDLLMGEVDGKRPEGFDFGNSPYEISQADVSGKSLVQSTRAGTVGVAIGPNSQAYGLGPRVAIHDVAGNVLARLGDAPESEEPGHFIAPHGVCINSRGDIFVGEVSWTHTGSHLNPPREIRSLQKLTKMA